MSWTEETANGQCNTFPLLDDDPVCEQDEDPVCEQEDDPVGEQAEDPVCEQKDNDSVQYWFDFNHLGLVGQKKQPMDSVILSRF